MEVVHTLDIDGTQWELQDVEARNKITTLEEKFNSFTKYKKNEEINTGAKWIDNKTIYRKVFYSEINWKNESIIGNIGNINTVINITSLCQYNDGRWLTNFSNSLDDNTVAVYENGNVIAYRNGGFVNNKKSIVIIEYTKTTN